MRLKNGESFQKFIKRQFSDISFGELPYSELEFEKEIQNSQLKENNRHS